MEVAKSTLVPTSLISSSFFIQMICKNKKDPSKLSSFSLCNSWEVGLKVLTMWELEGAAVEPVSSLDVFANEGGRGRGWPSVGIEGVVLVAVGEGEDKARGVGDEARGREGFLFFNFKQLKHKREGRMTHSKISLSLPRAK